MTFNPSMPLDTAEVERLLDNEVPESRFLDYKRSPPEPKDREGANKFLNSVVAFANANGGAIIYGIAEKSDGEQNTGLPGELVGVEPAEVDATIRLLTSQIESRIVPSHHGVRISPLEVRGKILLVVQVQRGWSGPYLFTVGEGTHRGSVRKDRSNSPMDWYDLRDGFLLRGTLRERIEGFRRSRLVKLVESTLGFNQVGLVLLHVLPYSAFLSEDGIDMRPLIERQRRLDVLGGGGGIAHPNFEGVVIRDDDGAACTAFTQVFREGQIEAATHRPIFEREQSRFFFARHVEQAIVEALPEYLKLLAACGAVPPVAVSLSLAGIDGAVLPRDMRFYTSQTEERYKFDRSSHLLPLVELPTFDADVWPALRNLFDGMWQGAGHNGSLSFDGQGRWHAPG